jgi:hypothetical protein
MPPAELAPRKPVARYLDFVQFREFSWFQKFYDPVNHGIPGGGGAATKPNQSIQIEQKTTKRLKSCHLRGLGDERNQRIL